MLRGSRHVEWRFHAHVAGRLARSSKCEAEPPAGIFLEPDV